MSIRHIYSQTVADGTATSVVRPSDWNSVHNQILNMGGNTAGTSQISGADIVWAGGNNVTLSANGSTVSIIGPTVPAQTVQTQASGNIVGAGFTSASTAGTAVVATQNSAGLSMGIPAYLTTAQAPGAYLTTAAQSDHSHNFATTVTAGSVVNVATANSAGATVGMPAFITTYAAQTNQTAASGNIAGVGTTFAGTNVSGSMTLNSNGLNLALSAPAPGGGGAINVAAGTTNGNLQTISFVDGNGVSFGLNGSTITASAAGGGGAADGNNVLGVNGVATSASTTYVLSNGNNVSFGLNAGTITATATFAQSVQTQAAGNIAGTGYTSTTQAGSTVGATHNTAGLSMAWPPFLTTSPAQSVQTQASGNLAGIGYTSTTQAGSTVGATHNTAGLSMAWPPFITTATQSVQTQASGNLAGIGYTSTTQAGSTVGATQNTAGLSMAWPPYITTYVAQTNQTVASGNIAGVGTTFGGTNVSGSMTLNSNGLALSLSAGAGGVINQTGPNIAVAGQTVTAGTVYFSNSPTVTFGMDGASNITASAAGGGGGAAYTQNLFQPELYGNTALSTLSTGTVYFRPFELNNYLDADRFMFQQSLVSLTSTRSLSGAASGVINTGGTGSWGMTGMVALYSRVNTVETNASFNSIVSYYSKSYTMGAGYTLSQSQSTNVSSATVSYSSTAAVSFVGQIDSTGGFTTTFQSTSTTGSFSSTSTGAGTFGSSIVMAAPYSYLSGIRPVWVPGPGTNMPPGEYWLGYQFQTTTGSTGSYSLQAPCQMSLPGQVFFTISTNNFLEIGNSVPFTTSNWRLGFGSLSASSLTTGNIGLSQISNMASNASQYFAIYGHTK